MLKALRRIPPSIVSTIGFLLVWQLLTSTPLLEGVIPTASSTLVELGTLLTQSENWVALGQTIVQSTIGFTLAVVVAVPIGVALGLSRIAYLMSEFTLNFLRVMPVIVILPLSVLIFGPTEQMAVFIVAWPIFFLMMIQVAYGVRDTDPVLIDTLKCYQQGWFARIYLARLPSAAPFLAIGLRMALIMAFLGSIIAGLIGGAPGLGFQLFLSQQGGSLTAPFAYVVILGLAGLFLSRFVDWLEPRIVFWSAR